MDRLYTADYKFHMVYMIFAAVFLIRKKQPEKEKIRRKPMSLEGILDKKKKRIAVMTFILFLSVFLSACAGVGTEVQPETEQTVISSEQDTDALEEPEDLEEDKMDGELQLFIDGELVPVRWEENESVTALRALVKDSSLTINMSMYGGFEQVGALGSSLPRNDKQTTTEAGDIVLYSGNQIVLFYGSNSWSYTRLGKMEKSDSELSDLLGKNDVVIEIKAE